MPSEDISITTDKICPSATPGGGTHFKAGLTRNKGEPLRFRVGNRNSVMPVEGGQDLDPPKTSVTKTQSSSCPFSCKVHKCRSWEY